MNGYCECRLGIASYMLLSLLARSVLHSEQAVATWRAEVSMPRTAHRLTHLTTSNRDLAASLHCMIRTSLAFVNPHMMAASKAAGTCRVIGLAAAEWLRLNMVTHSSARCSE